MKMKFLLLLCLLFTIIAVWLVALPASAQACAVRTDWSTYTIVRGDTLFRIATRYHTTTAILSAANCISNSSRIFVGQVLRVPPGSGGVVTGVFDIPVTFQQYEKGFMIWRGDTGDVWVYIGQSSGNVMRFLSASYGRLTDNPVLDPTPTGRVLPIMGFGRVWGNYPSVRDALGWATNPERSFIMRYTPVSSTVFYFSLPDNRIAVTNNSQIWSLSNGPIPTLPPPTLQPSPTPTGNVDVRVSYQPFEHGFMIWRSDGSQISVYQDQTGLGGLASYFPPTSYAGLPDNPISGPPAGRVRPILGFGKVWGNFDWVRTSLGWATGGELAYTASFRVTQTSHSTYFNLPDGRTVFVSLNQFWSYGNNNPPPPSATSTPMPQTVTVTVNAAYQLFENGFLLWRADIGRIDEFNKAYIAGYNLDQYQFLPDNPVSDQPPTGRVKPINGFGRVWGNFPATRNALGWGLGNEQGYQATFKTDTVTNVICVNLPDGRFVSYSHYVGNRSWTWQDENSCG